MPPKEEDNVGRHNLYIPNDLWEKMRKAAADAGARVGRTVSVSEWLRRAAERALERET